MNEERVRTAVRAMLARVGAVEGGGLSGERLARRERALGGEVPGPVRALLGLVGAEDWVRAVPGVRLVELEELEWVGDEEEGRFFLFAAGIYGDAIYYCSESPRHRRGAILLSDHEAGDMVVLESDLARWVERLNEFGGVEYAYMMGELAGLAPEAARRFLTRHVELNPGSEWGARGLMALGFPGGHPLGYHHWDAAQRRLLPIGEAGDVRDITVSDVRPLDLESVARAGRCERLMLNGGELNDFTPLERLERLRSLYVYTFPEVDAATLQGVSGLEDVCFLRCRVRNLSRLGMLKNLKRVRLNECEFEEGELAELRRLKPGVGIER